MRNFDNSTQRKYCSFKMKAEWLIWNRIDKSWTNPNSKKQKSTKKTNRFISDS